MKKNITFYFVTVLIVLYIIGSFKEELVGTSIPINVIISLFIGIIWGYTYKGGISE